jgi:hypothetical protein
MLFLAASNLGNQALQITNTSKEGSNTAGPYNSGQWLDLFHPSFEGVQVIYSLFLASPPSPIFNFYYHLFLGYNLYRA